jgi:hypothetical protein
VLTVAHRPQAGHAVLVSAPGLVGRCLPGTGAVLRDSLDISRLLLAEAKVAVSPGHALGFEGPHLRIVFGSVGARHTYPADAPREVAAVAHEVLRHSHASPEAAGRILHVLAPAPEAGREGVFEPGRDLIRAAFLDRMMTLLRRILTTPQTEGARWSGSSRSRA